MHGLLVPVVPLSGARMLAASAHVLVGVVVGVERGATRRALGATVAAVRVVVRVERVVKGPVGVGESVEFRGASIVAGVSATGVAETVPGSLAAGDRVEIHLAEANGRLILPFWLALVRLP